MQTNFNYFGQAEKPQVILTKSDGTQVSEIVYYDNLVINDKYNDVSEISFNIYKDGDNSYPDYDLVVGKKYLEIDGYGIYIVDDYVEVNDGIFVYKSVKVKSVDLELVDKRITLEPTVYELYNVITPENSLLGRIISKIPSWSIGSVDSLLYNQFRYFDENDITLLDLLYNKIGDSFQCIFEPDYVNREINLVAISNVGEDSDILLSHYNLVNNIEIKEISNEIVTSLRVFGGNGLSINLINPTGTNNIVNWDYFKDTDFISQALIDAIGLYETKYATQQANYEALILQYKTKNDELVQLQIELSILEAELLALETQQRLSIQSSQSIASIASQIANKRAEIISKENEIDNKTTSIDGIIASLNVIVSDLSIENNFTSEQIKDLDKITIEYTYQNEAYIITDSMTETEKQEQAELLFNDAEEILGRLSQPRFSFSIDVADFLKMFDYEKFVEVFELGNTITVELKEDTFVETRLISYSHDWDNNKLDLEFTNAYRTNAQDYLQTELFERSLSAGISVGFNQFKTLDWDRNSKDAVTSFITSNINATVNAIQSTDNQDILIDSNGARFRQSIDSNTFEDEQLWITNNRLVFSDDGFSSAKVALGKIQDSELGEIYGLIADSIVGKIIAGNTLIIENENNKFRVDATGATLTDAVFTVTGSNNKGKVIIDPDDDNIFTIQGNIGGTFEDVAYIDTDGRLSLSEIKLVSGTGLGSFTDAGALATQDDVDWSTQVSGSLKPEDNATFGANWNSNLLNIPNTLGAPTGQGLFLSSTNLGFYDNGTWKTYMDDSGNFYLGGTSGKLQWDASADSLTISGNISITGGSGISNLTDSGVLATKDDITSSFVTDAGSLITKDNVNWQTEVIGTGKPENNATFGANWNTNLLNIPNTLGAPFGQGLFLSSSNLGYYDNGTWKTYMDNNGNFYLGGTSGKLQWNAGTDTLVISGTLNSTIINSATINSATINSANISINENVSIGNILYLSGTSFGGGIKWGSSGVQIYIDPVTKNLFLSANNVYSNGSRIATQSWVNSQGFGYGDITSVTAGTGLSGGGTSGAVSLSIGSNVVTSTTGGTRTQNLDFVYSSFGITIRSVYGSITLPWD